MRPTKLTRGKWLAMMSLLGAYALAGPSPVGPAVKGAEVAPFAFAGILYGWVFGALTWTYAVQPTLSRNVHPTRKRRILYATVAITAAAIPLGILASRLLAR